MLNRIIFGLKLHDDSIIQEGEFFIFNNGSRFDCPSVALGFILVFGWVTAGYISSGGLVVKY